MTGNPNDVQIYVLRSEEFPPHCSKSYLLREFNAKLAADLFQIV